MEKKFDCAWEEEGEEAEPLNLQNLSLVRKTVAFKDQ
jgi:hypothetical protein